MASKLCYINAVIDILQSHDMPTINSSFQDQEYGKGFFETIQTKCYNKQNQHPQQVKHKQ